MPGQIRVGTASWTDKMLVESGLFYPPEVKTPEERLKYYASQFPIVEVDSSYYAMPNARTAMLWADRTPSDFVFDIKAFRLFTQHQTPYSALPADIRREMEPLPEGKKNVYYRDMPKELLDEMWRRYGAAIEPLKSASKLGVVLFQFPPWFTPAQASFEHIQHCADKLEGYQIALEFRNKGWFDERRWRQVLAFERENGLAHVVVDEPQGFGSSIPPVWEVTNPKVAVVRLHGRNAETWGKKGLASSAERFNYLYSTAELEALATNVRQLADAAQNVHVLFNNNYSNYAQRNAAAMVRLL